VSAKYEFIDVEKANYPIRKMCVWARVSASGFYEWRTRPMSATAQRRATVKDFMVAIFEDSDSTYGHRRLHAALARMGIATSLEYVRRLRRELGLVACQPRPWRPTTTVAGAVGAIPDLVERDFTAPTPGVKLVGDITYIATWEGWLYLATVIDCCTKECIGYAMADHMRTDLVISALDMAAANYTLAPKAIFHSDHGTQYTSADFARHTKRLGIRRSMGRTGVCWDNAMAESFNAAVKVERVNRTVYPAREHARSDVAKYIEFRYNRKCLHSALSYRTPHEVHLEHLKAGLAA
jgi:putative transposase